MQWKAELDFLSFFFWILLKVINRNKKIWKHLSKVLESMRYGSLFYLNSYQGNVLEMKKKVVKGKT